MFINVVHGESISSFLSSSLDNGLELRLQLLVGVDVVCTQWGLILLVLYTRARVLDLLLDRHLRCIFLDLWVTETAGWPRSGHAS